MCTCVYQWVQKYVSLLYKIRGREKYLMKYILLLRKIFAFQIQPFSGAPNCPKELTDDMLII